MDDFVCAGSFSLEERFFFVPKFMSLATSRFLCYFIVYDCEYDAHFSHIRNHKALLASFLLEESLRPNLNVNMLPQKISSPSTIP